MFSPWYVEALNGTLDLEPIDVARLEQSLAANPDDFPARLKLMAYHRRSDRAGFQEDRAKVSGHTLWLIEYHPDSEILHSYVSRFQPGELPAAEYQRAVELWAAAPKSASVQWNAASFFGGLDQGLYLHYLEITTVADPEHPYAIRPLADLYALALLEPGSMTSRAQAGLDASKNRWVLGNAAYMFQSQFNAKIQRGEKDPRAAELAERYFLRAKALDPSLDRKTILPQLDLAAIARAQQEREQAQRDAQTLVDAAVGKMRRLPVTAFTELPAAVAAVLRARGCTIPQPSQDATPRNAVRGQFFQNGESGWAVLCSVKNSTALLAFRNDRDTNPDTIATSNDQDYVQGMGDGKLGYSHGIATVGHEDILRSYRAYGGPEPPPMDHQGIDDAFLGKASSTWYFYRGQWLRLTGSD